MRLGEFKIESRVRTGSLYVNLSNKSSSQHRHRSRTPLWSTAAGGTVIESEIGMDAMDSTRGDIGAEETMEGDVGTGGRSFSFSLSFAKDAGDPATVVPESAAKSCARGVTPPITGVESVVVG